MPGGRGSCGCVAMDVGAGVVGRGGEGGKWPPWKSPELGAVWVIGKMGPTRRFGSAIYLAVVLVTGVSLGETRVCGQF